MLTLMSNMLISVAALTATGAQNGRPDDARPTYAPAAQAPSKTLPYAQAPGKSLPSSQGGASGQAPGKSLPTPQGGYKAMPQR